MARLRSQMLVAGIGALLVGMGCGGELATTGVGVGETLAGDIISTVADYELASHEVVGQQMAALGRWRDDRGASGRVYSFASPGNRVITGPLDNFEGLVESAPYLPLTDNQGYAIGRAVESGIAATVLVTLIDRSGELVAYRFYLSRQEDEPQRRWMTDAVYRFTPSDSGVAEPVIPTI